MSVAVSASFISAHQNFVIVPHTRPDGDAVGSAIALKEGLKCLGKKCQILLPSPVSEQLEFMNKDLIVFSETVQLELFDAIIVVDTCSWSQLGALADWFKGQSVPKLAIDHHKTRDDIGAIQFVSEETSSCCQLIYYLLKYCYETALSVHDLRHIITNKITPEIANYLFTGLALDTGWFKHDNTNVEALRTACELVKLGAKPADLYKKLFRTNSLQKSKLNGFVLSNLHVLDRICYVSVSQQDLANLSASPKDVDGLVNHTMGISGVDTGIMFIEEKPDFVKISLRSDTIDCSAIANSLGGGGHTKAAGFTSCGKLSDVITNVVDIVKGKSCTQQ